MNETTNPFSLSAVEVHRRMESLNPEQQEILYLLLQGKKYSEIAKILEIPFSHLDYYVTKAIEYTGAKNRAQLIAWYSVAAWIIEHRTEIVILRERD